MTKYNRLEFINWLNADETRKENLPNWSQNMEEENWNNLSSEFLNVHNWEERMKATIPKLIPYRKVFNKWKSEKDKATKEQEKETREEQNKKRQQEIRESLLLLLIGLLGLFLIYWFIKKKFQK